MIRIAICDDERFQAELLQGYVKEWGRVRREPADTAIFPSGDAFLFAWEEDKAWDVLLLDIQMSGIDGVELARKLRKTGAALPIVFVTGVGDRMAEGYEVEALHFLIKPINQDKLFACLDRAMEKSLQETALLLDTPDGGELRLSPRDIGAIEAAGRQIRIILGSGEALEAKARFREVSQALAPHDFIQCHRSYMVGLRYIRLLRKEQLILDCGAAIPVSRRLFQQVHAAFVRFYRET